MPQIVIKDNEAWDFNPLGHHKNKAIITSPDPKVNIANDRWQAIYTKDTVLPRFVEITWYSHTGYYVVCETGGNMNRGYARIFPLDVCEVI